jgi:hypothetical protein
MSDVTRILNAIEQGGTKAADELLASVYQELRLLAAFVLAVVWAAAKVFRTAILMYGKRPGLWEVIRWLRRSRVKLAALTGCPPKPCNGEVQKICDTSVHFCLNSRRQLRMRLSRLSCLILASMLLAGGCK